MIARPFACGRFRAAQAQRPDCMNTNLEYLTGGVVRRLGLTKRADRHAEGRVQLDQPVEVYQHPQQERIARFANPPQHRSFRFDADHKRNRQKDRIAVEWDRLQTVLRIKLGRSLARSEEHTSELQSLMRISYAVFSLKKK